jgi:hypothetical protein
MTSGVLYVPSGDERYQLLFDSIESVTRHEPELGICAASDVPLDVPFNWVRRRPGLESGIYKTRLAELSPFDETLYLSPSMSLRSKIGPLQAVLGDCDLAIAADSQCTTLRSLVDRPALMQTFAGEEAQMMRELAVLTPDAPYPSTSAIFFRKTESLKHLFDVWREEWLRFGGLAQPALARALHRSPVRMKILSREVICVPRPNESLSTSSGAKIVHYTALEPQLIGPLASPHRAFAAFHQALKHGLCSVQQYEAIGRIIVAMRPMNLLIFGCGADSLLWATLNKQGRTTFIESDPKYVKRAADEGLEVIEHLFPTLRGRPISASHKTPPSFVRQRAWDAVFIDGPPGFSPRQPGRELPICWSSQMNNKPLVIVHDYERLWERAWADRYLGPADLCIPGDTQKPQELAIWLRDRIKPGVLTT